MNPWHKKAREKRGIEVIVAEFPGWLFLVRPLDKWNKGYQRALIRVASQPEAKALLERQAVDGYVPNADDMDLDARLALSAFAEGCLAGWSGVTGADGEALDFTPEHAVRVLETFPEVSEALRLAAADPKNFAEPSDDDKVADILGNSVGASSSKKDRGAKRLHSAPAR